MLLVISDANVLIDIEDGKLTAALFSLDFDIAVPDTLFEEELREQHAHLTGMGLQTMSVGAEGVTYIEGIAATYRRASNNDLLALALARQEKCALVTGDAALRTAASAEGIDLLGTIWLVGQMVEQERITVAVAAQAYREMRTAGSRLPWAEVSAQLRAWGVEL